MSDVGTGRESAVSFPAAPCAVLLLTCVVAVLSSVFARPGIAAAQDGWAVSRRSLMPQSYDTWEAVRMLPGCSVRRQAHFGHGIDATCPCPSEIRWSYWEWFADRASFRMAPSPMTGIDSILYHGPGVPDPLGIIVVPSASLADTAAVSAVAYARGDWGREHYAGCFSGPLTRGARLDAVLWGDGWGGDRVGADWDAQHYEGRLVGRLGRLGFRRRSDSGGVLAPEGSESAYDTRRADRVEWLAAVLLPLRLTVLGEWSKDDELWKGDSSASTWVERGMAGIRYDGAWSAMRLRADVQWLQELVGHDLSRRLRQWRYSAWAHVPLTEDISGEVWAEARGDRMADWGGTVISPTIGGLKARLGAGQWTGWFGARERAAGFPRERWRGVGIGVGRDRPVRWELWGRIGRAWGWPSEYVQGELPWWQYERTQTREDVVAGGIWAGMEWRWLRVSGWGEHVARRPMDEESTSDRERESSWRALGDCCFRVPVREEVSVELGASIRGETIGRNGDADDRSYLVGAVRGVLVIGGARAYVCVVQPTGASWEEVPGYPLRAPMLYAGLEWSFQG